MPLPASGIQFGELDDVANGHYEANILGTGDAAAALQNILDNATLCPTRVTRPASGVGAGGLPTLGQRITFDSRGIYRFDSQVVLPRDKSITIDAGEARIVNNTGKAHVLRFQGSASWPPSGGLTASVCKRRVRGGIWEGGFILEDGQKPGIEIQHATIYGSATAGGELGYAVYCGRQCYTLKIEDLDIRQCDGGIYAPGVYSDDCHIRDVRIGWGGQYPDLVVNSAGTVIEGVWNFEARRSAYVSIPHVSIFPEDGITGRTGNMTSGSAVLSSISGLGTTGFAVGDLVGVYGAVAGDYLYALVTAVNSATQLTLSNSATASVTGGAVTKIVGSNDCTLRGLRFGGEQSADGGPPETCIVIGPTGSVSSAVRSRVRIHFCRPKSRSGNYGGPTATQSTHFVKLNAACQNCEIYDVDMSDGYATSPGYGFYSHPIKNAYGESSGGVNNYANLYSRLKLANYQSADLFSNYDGWAEV